MNNIVSISIFGNLVAITKCDKYRHHLNVTPASLKRLEALISRHTWHASIGGGRRYYGPLQEQAKVTARSVWPGEE